MTEDAVSSLRAELALPIGPGWQRFHCLVGGLSDATDYVEWSVKVRAAGFTTRRMLWAARAEETAVVSARLGDSLLRDHPRVLDRLTSRARQVGAAWDGDSGALKVYSRLEPGSVTFEEIWACAPSLPAPPPVTPTVTIGFVETPAWQVRYYLFWRRHWVGIEQLRWLNSVVGPGWAAALVTLDRGGIVVRETGEIDVAVGFPRGGLAAIPECSLAPSLHRLARREPRLEGRLGDLTWVTAPLSTNADPAELAHFALYVRRQS